MALKRRTSLVLATALFMCVSCAGRDFVRPTDDSLQLGKTTMQEIRQRFGEPRHQGSAIENEKAVKTFSYSYASGAGGLVGGVIPARAMTYSFYNDILVGYQFVSSFPEDRTDFSEAASDRIKKGTTGEREVIDLLGTPTGRYIYPIADRDGAAFVYAYTETRGPTLNIRLYRKTLRINFDPNGIVADVKFYSFGDK